jgi:hypothetical protein
MLGFHGSSFDRNTVDMKRVLYGPFTILIITITVGYVNVNDRILSFTIVVSIDLGFALEGPIVDIKSFKNFPIISGCKMSDLEILGKMYFGKYESGNFSLIFICF